MAEEETQAEELEEEEVVPEKKKSPVIMIVVAVIVGLLLAGGVSFFVARHFLASSNNETEEARYHDPGVFVKLGKGDDGIMVNVGGVKGGHFLKIGLVLEMNPGKKDNIVEGKINSIAETKILDTVLQILRSEPIDNFDASKQDVLKEKVRTELNKVLGGGSVYTVYITSLILQ